MIGSGASSKPPTRSWRTPWQDLLQVISDGEIVVETRDPGGQRIVARTVTQLDGDVITKWEAPVGADTVETHFSDIRERISALRLPLRQATMLLSAGVALAADAAAWASTENYWVVVGWSLAVPSAAFLGRHLLGALVLRGLAARVRARLAAQRSEE